MNAKQKRQAKTDRLIIANSIIKVISSYGRRFFWSERKQRVARFEINARSGRLYFRDDYTDESLPMSHMSSGKWMRKFPHGGTMKGLISNMGLFIRLNKPINIRSHFGPWPDNLCDGDIWGYGDDMAKVRDDVNTLIDTKGGRK